MKNDSHDLELRLIEKPNDKQILLALAKKYENQANHYYTQYINDKSNIELANLYKEKMATAQKFYEKVYGIQESPLKGIPISKNRNLKSKMKKGKRNNKILFLLILLLLFDIFFITYFSIKQKKADFNKYYTWIYKYPSINNDYTQKKSSNSLEILRSALYDYVLTNSVYPDDLNTLSSYFPNNYLSFIPEEETSNSNVVYTEKNNQGGWVYKKPTTPNMENLEQQVSDALFPNINASCNCKFKPLSILISKKDHEAILFANHEILDKYPVGLGKNNATPTGEFFIDKKVANPNHQFINSTKPFGTRGLELSNNKYAIHGTYVQESIGQNESKGCIRLSIADSEDLFSKTPLFTPVLISDKTLTDMEKEEVPSLKNLLFESKSKNQTSNALSIRPINPGSSTQSGKPFSPKGCISCEEDNRTIYHWSY